MRTAQLEALVLEAVAAARVGHHEDDRFEFKRTWPGNDKARQLAGSANRARGEFLVYVIGLDDDGTVVPPQDVDPATWFAQLESRFDGPAPEIRNHVRVAISETEQVVALEFDTGAAPYVVRTSQGGSPEMEVPIRAGSRTRSASRIELLRLLAPTLHVPRLEMLHGELVLRRSKDLAAATLNARLYFEYIRQEPLFLPLHESFADLVGPPNVDQREGVKYPVNGPTRPGILGTLMASQEGGLVPRPDGLPLNGPGTVAIRATWTFAGDDFDEVGSWGSPLVRLSFGIAGSEEVARGEFGLDHRRDETVPTGESKSEPRYIWRLADASDPRIAARRMAGGNS